MKEKEKPSYTKENIILVALGILSIAAMILGCFLYKIPSERFVQYGSFVLLGSFLIFFTSKQELLFDRLQKKEAFDAGRFFGLYLVALCIALFCPNLPIAVWPYPVIFLLLSLFSNTLSGIVTSSVCVFISVLLTSTADVNTFMMYFLAGIATVIFFRNLNQEYRIGYPIFLSELFLLLCIVLFSGYTINFDSSILLFACVNLVLSFILLLLVLKYYSSSIVHKNRDKYLELNDPESALIAELKEKNQKEYFKAIHVAHFCDNICARLGMDSVVTKAAAYHHNIAKAKFDHVSWENTEVICKEYQFPTEIEQVLKEFLDPATPIVKKETVILYFSQRVISAILYLFETKPGQTINYEEMIDSVYKKILINGKLANSDVSMNELALMRDLFVEEKLYYDFLRRE